MANHELRVTLMEKTFTLTLDGTDYEVKVHGNTFIVNGHPFVIGLEEGGGVSVDGIAYDITLGGDKAIVDGIVHQVQVSGLDAEPSGVSRPRPARSASGGVGAVQAIMPGTIVRVLAAEGDEVAANDVVLVLEAMKMENELQAPVSGVVKAIHVEPGQAVETNAVLAEIEPLG
jgi:biotin carboxyl carrier protein